MTDRAQDLIRTAATLGAMLAVVIAAIAFAAGRMSVLDRSAVHVLARAP